MTSTSCGHCDARNVFTQWESRARWQGIVREAARDQDKRVTTSSGGPKLSVAGKASGRLLRDQIQAAALAA